LSSALTFGSISLFSLSITTTIQTDAISHPLV
jgi:hypothetical protein